jgi:hypothetical protein
MWMLGLVPVDVKNNGRLDISLLQVRVKYI